MKKIKKNNNNQITNTRKQRKPINNFCGRRKKKLRNIHQRQITHSLMIHAILAKRGHDNVFNYIMNGQV